MKNKPSARLLRWADEEKNQPISVGVLTLGDVVAAATEQEGRETKFGTGLATALDESGEILRSVPASVAASSIK